jgi:hypothetical protein
MARLVVPVEQVFPMRTQLVAMYFTAVAAAAESEIQEQRAWVDPVSVETVELMLKVALQ